MFIRNAGKPYLPRLPFSLNLIPATGSIGQLFPAWRITGLGDLSNDDRSLWKSAHKDSVPGYCTGNFVSKAKGQLEYACLLVPKEPLKQSAYIILLLTHQERHYGDTPLLVQVLESDFNAPSIPVIWTSKIRTIVECETKHRFQASGDVLVVENLEASSAAFFWNDNRWVSVLTSE